MADSAAYRILTLIFTGDEVVERTLDSGLSAGEVLGVMQSHRASLRLGPIIVESTEGERYTWEEVERWPIVAASRVFLAEFWEGQDTSPLAIASFQREHGRTRLEEVQGYLDGFDAADLSDRELQRCTQGSDLLFHLAVVFREAGMLQVGRL